MFGLENKQLGELIREYRLQHIQVHNKRPWTQEDLAVAIGSDKAHINRIENGQYIPSARTLEKIFAAMNLNWSQKQQILYCAGKLSMLPSPEEYEIQEAVRFVRPYLEEMEVPAIMEDNDAIIWDINDMEAYLFYNFENKTTFLEECQGLRFIEILMTPKFNDYFQHVIENYDVFLNRQVKRFMDLYFKNRDNYEYNNILNRFLDIDEFKKIWMKHLNYPLDSLSSIPFVDHQIVKMNHPAEGRFEIQIWHTTASFDERFDIIQHWPNNESTQKLFFEWIS